jgi:hypothetical protein
MMTDSTATGPMTSALKVANQDTQKTRSRRVTMRAITKINAGVVLIGLLLAGVCGAADTKQPTSQVLILNLSDQGFEPARATVKAGKIFLVIRNRSLKGGLTFSIASSASSKAVTSQGATAASVSSRAAQLNSAMLLQLTSGTYTLAETTEKKWTFALTVQ